MKYSFSNPRHLIVLSFLIMLLSVNINGLDSDISLNMQTYKANEDFSLNGQTRFNITSTDFIPNSTIVNIKISNTSNKIHEINYTLEEFLGLSDNHMNLEKTIAHPSTEDSPILMDVFKFKKNPSIINTLFFDELERTTIQTNNNIEPVIFIPLDSIIFNASFNLSGIPVGGVNASDITVLAKEGSSYTRDWSVIGGFNDSEIVFLNKTKLQNYADNCLTSYSGNCQIPVNITFSGGSINIRDIKINYQLKSLNSHEIDFDNLGIFNLYSSSYTLSIDLLNSSQGSFLNLWTNFITYTGVLAETYDNSLTMNFSSQPNIESVDMPYIGRENTGQINWTGSNINLSGYDFDSFINISNNYIYLNSTILPNLNSSANIILLNLFYKTKPLIYVGEDGGWQSCEVCNHNSIYDTITGTLAFNVSHFSAYTTGANTNLSIWDDVSQDGETNTTITFTTEYTNITNTSNPIRIQNASCNITFEDGVSLNMTENPSHLYQASRLFPNGGNFSYNITCNATSLETLTANDWISISLLSVEKPILWSINNVSYSQNIDIVGYIAKPNINVTAYVHDFNKTQNVIASQISGGASIKIGEYIVEFDRVAGESQIIINGTDFSNLQDNYFLEFSNHNRTYYYRYDIQTISIAGPNSRSIAISPALESDILAGTNISVYSSQIPSGFFNISIQLFSNITNYIEVWGTDLDQNIGEKSYITTFYDLNSPQIIYAGDVYDYGITSIIENLSFSWDQHLPSSNYEISIGTSKYQGSGYDSLLPWASTGNMTNYSQVFDLDIDTVYYANIRVINGSISSNVVSSNGIIYLDVTPPTCIDCVQDGNNWTNNPTINGWWNFSEPESDIEYYEYEVGTGKCYDINSSNIRDKTMTVYPYASAPISNPIDGQVYYFNVWAKNTENLRNGKSVCYSSKGIRYDGTAPYNGSISYPGGIYNANTIDIDYEQGIDNNSGILKAEIWQKISTINITPGACGSFGAASLLKNLSGASPTSVTVNNGYCYQFELRIYDRAGNVQIYNDGDISYNLSVDASSPSKVTVSDGNLDFTTFRDLYFNWSISHDNDSGIKGYYNKLYEADEDGTTGRNDLTNWTFTTGISANFNNLALKNCTRSYFLEVYAVNNFNLASNITRSDGIIFFDNNPPEQLDILDISGDDTEPYFILTNISEVNVSVYGEPGEICEVSLYDIDFLSIADEKVILNFTTNSSAFGFFTLNSSYINEGENKIYIVCRDINGNPQHWDENTEFTFTIDTQPPSIEVSPINNSRVTGIVNFIVNVSDYYRVKAAYYKVVNATSGNIWDFEEGNVAENGWLIPVNFQSIPETESFLLIINATDNNDRNIVKNFTYLVDNTIPEINYFNTKRYYNQNFTLNFTFEMFSNYSIILSKGNETVLSIVNNSDTQKLLENVSVSIEALTDWTSWDEGNYTLIVEAANIFGERVNLSSGYVIDRTSPIYHNLSATPNPLYQNDDAYLSIIWEEVYLDNIILQHNAENGSMKNYTLEYLGDNIYNLSIDEEIIIDGKTVYMYGIINTSIIINVDGEIEVIDIGDWESINGLKINCTHIHFEDENTNRYAIIRALINLSNTTSFTYTIDSSNLTNQQAVNYSWTAIDKAGNMRSTTMRSFTVQNRVPSTVTSYTPNNSIILNKEDYIVWLYSYDFDYDNLTFGVKNKSDEINITIFDYLDYTYAKISASNTSYIGSAWAIFNVSDGFGGTNESINYTFNITESIGLSFNINTTEEIKLYYFFNDIFPELDNSLSYYTIIYNNSIRTAVPIGLNSSNISLLIDLNTGFPASAVYLSNLNISLYDTLNLTFILFNSSLINETEFENNNYNILDSYIFKLDDYDEEYFVLWDYDEYNITDYNATNFLGIFKLNINISNNNITYNSSASADNLYYDISEGIIWGTFTNFSLFVLAEEKPSAEICGNTIDEDHDGIAQSCPPDEPSGNSPSSGSPSTTSYTSSGSPEEETCYDKIKNQDEEGIDCGGVCTGYWYNSICNINPQGNCTDGIKNQDEEGIDCGGTCEDACPILEQPSEIGTCFDNIKNQDEDETDCGGICGGYWYDNHCDYQPRATCYDNIKNQGETKIDCGGPCNGCESKFKLLGIIAFILGGIIIIGGAIGFVLVQKHNNPQDYKMPASPQDELIPQIKIEKPSIIETKPDIKSQKTPDNIFNFQPLIKFINKKQGDGTLNSRIKIILLRNGWPHEIIEEAFEKCICAKRLSKLDKYIKNAKSNGDSDDLIRHNLLKAKWSVYFIEMVLHEVHVLHDDFEKIKKYAKKMISKGYNKEEIIKTLTDIGWIRSDVEPYVS